MINERDTMKVKIVLPDLANYQGSLLVTHVEVLVFYFDNESLEMREELEDN